MTNYNVEYMIIANSEEKRDSVIDYLTHLSLFDEKKMKTGVKIGKKSKTQWYYRYGKRFISEGLPFYDLGPIESITWDCLLQNTGSKLGLEGTVIVCFTDADAEVAGKESMMRRHMTTKPNGRILDYDTS